jgi:hypothetical protein
VSSRPGQNHFSHSMDVIEPRLRPSSLIYDWSVPTEFTELSLAKLPMTSHYAGSMAQVRRWYLIKFKFEPAARQQCKRAGNLKLQNPMCCSASKSALGFDRAQESASFQLFFSIFTLLLSCNYRPQPEDLRRNLTGALSETFHLLIPPVCPHV